MPFFSEADQVKKLIGMEYRSVRTIDRQRSCYVRYPATDTTFATQSLYLPSINCEFGDVNFDGLVDAVDASAVLRHYASVSAGKDGTVRAERQHIADVDENGIIDAVDASAILALYAKRSVAKESE